MSETLTPSEASEAAPGWRVLSGHLHLSLDCGSFSGALDFVGQVGRIAEELQHHPDIDIRYSRVHLAVASHDVNAFTVRDVRFTTEVSQLVDRLGLIPDHARLDALEIAIDTLDADSIRPFWRAVLGYEEQGDDLIDPDRITPLVWFQQMDAPRPQRNRIHLDVHVPHDEVEGRLAAALDAGGTLVSDAHAPNFWVLADTEGNEACLCTWQEAASA